MIGRKETFQANEQKGILEHELATVSQMFMVNSEIPY